MKNNFSATISAIVLSLLGFIWMILEEDIQKWGRDFFGDNYKIVLLIIAVLLIIIAFIVDRNKGGNKKEEKREPLAAVSTEITPQPLHSPSAPKPPTANPTERFPTRSEYEAIEKEFADDNLTEALDLMNKIGVYRNRVPQFRRQLNQLLDTEIENVQPEITRNEIANGLIKFIQSKQPQEEYETPSTSEGGGSSQTHIVKNPDESILWVSRNFLGRADKIAEINELLASPQSPDIAVTGLAGNGKTTLCNYVISEWLREQPGRVAYVVEVEFITSVEGLSRALASLCGLDPDRCTQTSVLTAMQDLPGGLLYLDNLESILEDKEAHDYLNKLRGCRQLQIMASSRREVAGFQRVRLDVLSEGDALELFRRNWRAQTGEALPATDDELLTEFVTKDLGCHPLSVELTASHAATVTDFGQLVTEFRDSSTSYFTRFASGEDGRLNNLAQSLGLSINRLKDRPDTLRLLALGAIFETGLDGPMQKVLIKNSLITPTDRSLLIERNLARNSEGYLSLLPPVIRFLRALLTEGNSLFDQEDLLAASEVLITDKSLVVTSRLEGLAFYSTLASEEPKLGALYHSFGNLDFLRNLFVSRPILETLEARFATADKENDRANVLTNLGEIEFREGRNEQARTQYLKANDLYQKTGDEQGQANVLTNLGEIEFIEGRNEQARTQYLKANDLYQKTGDELGQANVLTNLGEIEFIEGRNEQARTQYLKANDLYQKTGSEQGQANVLKNLGQIEFIEGRNEQARTQYLKANDLYQKTGSEQGQANVLKNLGQIEFREGRNEQARTQYLKANDLYQKTGDELGQANVLKNLGQIEFIEGRNEQARTQYLKANDLYQKTGSEQGQANVLKNLGQIEFIEGRNEQARTQYLKANDLYQKTGSEQGQANVLKNLGQIEFREGRNEQARTQYLKANDLYQKTGDELGQANVLKNLGEIEFIEGRNEQARTQYLKANDLYQKTGDELGQANVLKNLGQIEFREGRNEQARTQYLKANDLYQKTGSEQGQANVLKNLGQIEFREGRNEQARTQYLKANDLYQKTGDELGQANVLKNLGEIEFIEGRNEQARTQYLKANDLYQKTGDELGQANVLKNLGQIEFREGRNEQARTQYLKANDLYQKTGSELGQAHINHYIAQTFKAEENLVEAVKYWEQALTGYRQIRANMDVADTLLYLAEAKSKNGSPATELAPLLAEAEGLIEKFGLENLRAKLARLKG